MINAKFLTVTAMILMAALSRLLPHPANFTPLVAMALFGAAKLSDKRLALLIPLAAMFVSDLFLGFHAVMPVIYVSFILIGFLGFTLRHQKNIVRLAATTLTASLFFFVSSNFGVWMLSTLYPKTVSGLVTCFTLAIPFFQHSLAGDVLYSVTLFGGYAVVNCWLSMVGSAKVQQ